MRRAPRRPPSLRWQTASANTPRPSRCPLGQVPASFRGGWVVSLGAQTAGSSQESGVSRGRPVHPGPLPTAAVLLLVGSIGAQGARTQSCPRGQTTQTHIEARGHHRGPGD